MVRFNYTLDENQNYTSVTTFPLNEELPIREVTTEEFNLISYEMVLREYRKKLHENPNSLFLKKIVSNLEDAINK